MENESDAFKQQEDQRVEADLAQGFSPNEAAWRTKDRQEWHRLMLRHRQGLLALRDALDDQATLHDEIDKFGAKIAAREIIPNREWFELQFTLDHTRAQHGSTPVRECPLCQVHVIPSVMPEPPVGGIEQFQAEDR